MNYYEHHLGDYMRDTAHLSILEDGVYRRLIDAYYIREAPLPADRKRCYKLARAQSKAEREAVDSVLEEFFDEENDGFHHKRCDEELAKYLAKQPEIEEKKENDKERQRRARERRKALFHELSALGFNMPWNATTAELEAELSRVKSQPVTQPVTRDNTATHTPDTRHQTPVLILDTSTHIDTSPAPDWTSGQLAAELIKLGVSVTGQHPMLLDWHKAYTYEQILEAVALARQHKPEPEKIPAKYLNTILSNPRSPPKRDKPKSFDDINYREGISADGKF